MLFKHTKIIDIKNTNDTPQIFVWQKLCSILLPVMQNLFGWFLNLYFFFSKYLYYFFILLNMSLLFSYFCRLCHLMLKKDLPTLRQIILFLCKKYLLQWYSWILFWHEIKLYNIKNLILSRKIHIYKNKIFSSHCFW